LTNQTAQQSGFHSDNLMIENINGEFLKGTDDVIAKMALATASDRGTVATLTATNSKLTTRLEEAQAYTNELKQDIVDLDAKIKPT
jgi:hypothetical protein